MCDRKKEWVSEEIELLESIKKTYKEKKWKLISKNLAKKGFKRTEHECRHKWVNCLNPEINHGPWTQQQLKILYTEYQMNQSQWSIIQKALPNRTQIRIKNHFYGLLRNIMRFVLKYFKMALGRESDISNKINPNSLQLIYRSQDDYCFMQGCVRDVIHSMGFHFDKQKLLKVVQKNTEIFTKLNEKLLQQTSSVPSEAKPAPHLESNENATCAIFNPLETSRNNTFYSQEPTKNETFNMASTSPFIGRPVYNSRPDLMIPQMVAYNPLLDPFFLSQQLMKLNSLYLNYSFPH